MKGCPRLLPMLLLVLATHPAHADRYWMDSSSLPIRDSAGDCVRTGIPGGDLQPGCDPMDRVILLPDAEGHVGAVQVRLGDRVETLDRAYGAIHVSREGQLENDQASAQEVDSRFGTLLEQQPLPAERFVLRFRSGSARELTPDSVAVIERLMTSLQARQAPEVRIIGHTDRVGSVADNDRLSLQRAQTLAEILSAQGIAAEMMEVTGRGEREPAVDTADGVDEPRNRRVEISIR